jgi:hypothetical protein
MAELDAERQAKMIGDYDHLLHLLASTYDHLKRQDDNEEQALGGVGMVLSEIVTDLPPTATLIVCLAARQIAKHRRAAYEASRA